MKRRQKGLKIDEKNDARSVDAGKFEICLFFPIKKSFFMMTEIRCSSPSNIIYVKLPAEKVTFKKIGFLEF